VPQRGVALRSRGKSSPQDQAQTARRMSLRSSPRHKQAWLDRSDRPPRAPPGAHQQPAANVQIGGPLHHALRPRTGVQSRLPGLRRRPLLALSGHGAMSESCPLWGGRVRRASRISETHLKKLASILHREHVCIEIGNPLLALLCGSKVAQGISDIRSNHLPEEIWIVSSEICDAIVFQFIAHSRLAKLVK
jgi:hypothetical protein